MTDHETALALYHLLPAEAWEWGNDKALKGFGDHERIHFDGCFSRQYNKDPFGNWGDDSIYPIPEAIDRLCTLALRWLRKGQAVVVDGPNAPPDVFLVDLIDEEGHRRYFSGNTELEAVLAACKAVVGTERNEK